jgi:hypothetical protein
MKKTVRFINLLGIVAYVGLLSFAAHVGNWGDDSGTSNAPSFLHLAWAASPLVSFVISFCTSFVSCRNSLVLWAGIVGHIFLAAFVVGIFLSRGSTNFDTGTAFLLVWLFFACCWGLMYFALPDDVADQSKQP